MSKSSRARAKNYNQPKAAPVKTPPAAVEPAQNANIKSMPDFYKLRKDELRNVRANELVNVGNYQSALTEATNNIHRLDGAIVECDYHLTTFNNINTVDTGPKKSKYDIDAIKRTSVQPQEEDVLTKALGKKARPAPGKKPEAKIGQEQAKS